MNATNPSPWSLTKQITLAVVGAGIVASGVVGVALALQGESEDDAKADLCDSLTDFSATVEDYQELHLSSATNDEVETAYDDLEAAWDDVLDEGDEWVNAYDNELTNAYWDLYYAVEDLPGDNTMSENIDDLQPELSAFPEAFSDTIDGGGCSDA